MSRSVSEQVAEAISNGKTLERHGRIHTAPSWVDSRRNVLFAYNGFRITLLHLERDVSFAT
jgi:hypothetical protein